MFTVYSYKVDFRNITARVVALLLLRFLLPPTGLFTLPQVTEQSFLGCKHVMTLSLLLRCRIPQLQ